MSCLEEDDWEDDIEVWTGRREARVEPLDKWETKAPGGETASAETLRWAGSCTVDETLQVEKKNQYNDYFRNFTM